MLQRSNSGAARSVGPRWRVFAIAIAAAAALSGCVSGPNFVAPAAPSAAGYSADALPNLAAADITPDSTLAPAGEWWALLNSERLDSTIRQALSANHSLAAARATLAEAQSTSDAAESGRYPHVDLDAGAGR